MRLVPHKGGHGHITSYRATIGSEEARRLGFVDKDGKSVELEKVVDEEKHELIIRLKEVKPSD